MYTINEMIFIFLFWGIAGWLIEVVDMRIETGELQNRGFLHIPICPLYGIGMLLMCIIFRNERVDFADIFMFGVIVGTFVEYCTGWLLEILFNTRWWDYSHMRFQVKGRICLRNSILFGFGAIFTIGFIQPVVDEVIYRVPDSTGMSIICMAIFVLIVDTIASVVRALKYRDECDMDKVFVVFKSHK